jgi:hypothetical protein
MSDLASAVGGIVGLGSLVLIGIRGCGKRSLGFVAATALKRRFITEDHYFILLEVFLSRDARDLPEVVVFGNEASLQRGRGDKA